MSTFYFVRHAESIANTQGIYQGQSYDTDLSYLGYTQASKLAEYLSRHKITRIITSPLTRTRKTALFCAHLHPKATLQSEYRIIEVNHGQWEGKSKTHVSLTWPHLYRTWQITPSRASFPGGERFSDAHQRVISWWESVKNLPGNTLVVTHDNIIRILLTHFQQVSLDDIWKISLQPAAVTIVRVDRQEIGIPVLNDVSHLGSHTGDLSRHAL